MDLIKNLKLGTAAEIAITVLIVYVLTQAIKQTKISNKWLPWIAMILGIFSGLVSVPITGDSNYLTSAVMGFLVGGFTAGLFDGFSGFIKKASEEAKQIIELNPQDQGQNSQGNEIPDTQTKGDVK